MNILKRFKDPVILGTTIVNLAQIIAVIWGIDTSEYVKIGDVIISLLLQIGILKQPNATKRGTY